MADAYLSASGPVQACVAELLAVSAPTRAAVQARLHENLQTLRRILYGSSISLLHLEAGWYAVLLLPNVEVTVKTQPEPTSDWDWALELLHFANVLLQPGWFYDMTDSRAVVVSLLTPQLEFEQGMLRVVARVTQLVA
jgi:aspartate/methionine/tyrosine aminotransferase